jgi:hypothetical protein
VELVAASWPGAHVEHWLNGKKVVEYELWSPDWEGKVKASKFKDCPTTAAPRRVTSRSKATTRVELALRNIRIRELHNSRHLRLTSRTAED